MRTGLAPHLGEQVLCKGWIAFWEDLQVTQTRRLVISSPIIRKADRNRRFEQQQLLSREHHLNLFIRWQDLPNYDTTLQLHEPIQFSGVVQEYSRADGSTDFGVYSGSQSTLPTQIKRICLTTSTANAFDPSTKHLIQDHTLPAAEQVLIDLEEAGDMLPTFDATYGEYKALLEEEIRCLRYFLSSSATRKFRRDMKKRRNPLTEIVGLSS